MWNLFRKNNKGNKGTSVTLSITVPVALSCLGGFLNYNDNGKEIEGWLFLLYNVYKYLERYDTSLTRTIGTCGDDMKILYVMNNAYTKGNGLAGSCRRTVQFLQDAGEDVRILSAQGPDGEKPDYVLPDDIIPIFSGIIKKQGYAFAKCDDDVIREAVRWADVVHLDEPFDLQIRTCKIAEEEKKALTATYHLHPEHFYASVHLRKSRYLNSTTMMVWMNTVFNRCRIVQCPTENVRKRLERWHCRAELRVISNGMLPDEPKNLPSPIQKPDGIFLVVTTGRYSEEKDQITLMKAMRFSKYADRIQLVFAGRGPIEQKLRKEADVLLQNGTVRLAPIFGFYSLSELQAIYRQADLYIHCAIIEVEGMSCMEAIQTGLVPIIAEGKLTATPQFALSKESIFHERDAKELAERIDYWLSDDDRREHEEKRYIGMGAEYDIRESIEQLQQMYSDAIQDI